MTAKAKPHLKDLTPHAWERYGPGDFPRWMRYQCKNCGSFGQFHVSVSVNRQSKHNCKGGAKK